MISRFPSNSKLRNSSSETLEESSWLFSLSSSETLSGALRVSLSPARRRKDEVSDIKWQSLSLTFVSLSVDILTSPGTCLTFSSSKSVASGRI
ncbi:hypothetical protein OGAPHI_002301 [Ogataea philodendri]|uniref:Uncharacterized protein n=1 Tax=Ogataea philodendri TaxID=1378263 RepID=A0A9P8PC19_9ASCO|nr:uncharacterized protein OGAPHI_002301 [Ogataea philodendri]KAH3668547.1 hypothetical protein OGAPHI_002301 [Ogataea philodendri]